MSCAHRLVAGSAGGGTSRARPRSRWVTCLCLEQAAKRQVSGWGWGSLEWVCMHLKVCSEGPTSAFCIFAQHPSSCLRLMPPLGLQRSLPPVPHSSVTSPLGSFTAVPSSHALAPHCFPFMTLPHLFFLHPSFSPSYR